MRTFPLAALRRHVIAAQGYTTRARLGTTADIERTIRALSCVQLDSISVVERSHRIALASRVGTYPRDTVSRLLREGSVFEYWAHEASLIPVADWPLFRPAMEEGGRLWWSHVEQTHPHLHEEILETIRERGPLGSRDFEGTADKGMWERKPAKAMLDRLWNRGELAIAGRRSFQRLYDLTERVIPRAVLDAPTPPEPERLRQLALRAVAARGALTERGIVEHWRLQGGVKRIAPVVDSLVGDGLVERVAVEDGGPPVVVAAGADPESASPTAAVLLSPFDNLLWDRPFARRVLGFDHLIEVYKKPHERQYG
ncbi:MAG: winged helix-turn-helix domain-containing protein, partial [Gaiella sp.]